MCVCLRVFMFLYSVCVLRENFCVVCVVCIFGCDVCERVSGERI